MSIIADADRATKHSGGGYAVSLAKSRNYKTPIGVFSVHHAEPDFFYGYELDSSGWAKIAVPEKALLDIFYFAPTKSRLFGQLPELELPHRLQLEKNFSDDRSDQEFRATEIRRKDCDLAT